MNSSISYSISEIAEICDGEIYRYANNNNTLTRIITDTRKDCGDSLFVPLRGDKFDGHNFIPQAIEKGAKAVLAEAEYINKYKDLFNKYTSEISFIIVADTLKAYQAIAGAHRCKFKELSVIALTGSCGKTSTKEILKSIFTSFYSEDEVLATEWNTNNQIGVAQNLLRIRDIHKIAVIEIGTNHHGEILPLTKISEPDIAIIVSIAPCHTEFFGNIEGVAREKVTIFAGLNETGTAVIPAESPVNDILLNAAQKYKYYTFGCNRNSFVSVEYLKGNIQGSEIKLTFNTSDNKSSYKIKTCLRGRHQALNAAAAAAAAYAYNVPPDIICAGISGCRPDSMRSQVYIIDGITWINDAYNANPSSVHAGLCWLKEFVHNYKSAFIVLGDMLELGNITIKSHTDIIKLAERLFLQNGNKLMTKHNLEPERKILILLVGKYMKTAFSNLPIPKNNFILASDTEEASEKLKDYLVPGSLVYLKASRGIALEKLLPDT